ncbi:hypothetical protein KP509_1Z079300 [Ceratopteris richardii]|nr:hypothetical protein KP509_1Z079300 [Ceratopteris richardii]
MNSFSAMQRAIDFEISRQVSLHGEGQASKIVQETRLWEEGSQRTITMRLKEGLADYRYFPEPDLPNVVIEKAFVDEMCSSLPELPNEKRRRYEGMGLSMQDVLILANDYDISRFFDEVLTAGADLKLAANWIMGDIAAYLKNEKMTVNDVNLTPEALAELILMIQNGTISGKIGKEVLVDLLREGGSAKSIVEAKGLLQISDPLTIAAMVDKVLAENPKQVEEYKSGKKKLQGFFGGQLMKASGGKINPTLMNKILLEKLNGN